MAARARVKSRSRGGYDCEFVTPPPDVFQIECPICLQIPKQPCLISCPCGKEFCRECIERIKEDNKPCPLCNLSDFTFLRHHGSERYLKAQEVWCSHKKDGCKWRGKLGEYERHLNEDSSSEKQQAGCQFVEIECEHGCGEWFQRHHIASHQNQECPERPYSCEHCHDYESTFEDVTKNHYPQCVKYPVTCPNKCRDAPFERQNVNNHVKDECPLTEVDCPLHYAGCEVRLPRKDMPEHMADTVTHLTLLATVTQSLLRENQEQKREVEILREETHQMKLMVGVFPIDFHVKYDKDKEKIYLRSFYTHSSGYQMRIFLNPNGYGKGKGTHVSLVTQLILGPYDNHLKWPFRGEITVQIANQAGDHSHVERTIHYNDETPDTAAGRVTDKESAEGKGFHLFLAHKKLEYNAAKKTQYLKDGIITVRVVKVKITQ